MFLFVAAVRHEYAHNVGEMTLETKGPIRKWHLVAVRMTLVGVVKQLVDRRLVLREEPQADSSEGHKSKNGGQFEHNLPVVDSQRTSVKGTVVVAEEQIGVGAFAEVARFRDCVGSSQVDRAANLFIKVCCECESE